MIERRRAQRYARAFINVYISTLTDQEIERYIKIKKDLQRYRHYLLFLQAVVSNPQELAQQLHALSPDRPFASLIDILIKHKSLSLLSLALNYIEQYYYEYQGISQWHITSSHEISNSHMNTIKKFLAAATRSTIICTKALDSSLIAGIRAQSANWLWERSLGRYMRRISHTLIR
jgi:F0F1-type ATP synthase delta subunit